MKIAGHIIGACSWSFRHATAEQTVERMRELGIEHLQLAIGNVMAMSSQEQAAYKKVWQDNNVKFTAGMIGFIGEYYTTIDSIRRTGGYVPDDLWPQRRQKTIDAGKIAADMGIHQVSTHIGFVPPSHDPHYEVMVDRLRTISQDFAELGLGLLMETGQERANELLQFLNDLGVNNVKINFDPANMILYGAGDPIEAVGILERHIGHVHLKDANLSDQPGVKWGKEVIFGRGQVGVKRFLEALRAVHYTGPLVFEQEIDGGLEGLKESLEALRTAEKQINAQQ